MFTNLLLSIGIAVVFYSIFLAPAFIKHYILMKRLRKDAEHRDRIYSVVERSIKFEQKEIDIILPYGVVKTDIIVEKSFYQPGTIFGRN